MRVRVTERAEAILTSVATAQRHSLERILVRLDSEDRGEFLRLLDVYLDALNATTGKIP